MPTTPAIWLGKQTLSSVVAGSESHVVATASGFSAFWSSDSPIFPSPQNIVQRAFGIDGLGIGNDHEADSFVGEGTGSQDRPAVATYAGVATVLVWRDTFDGATTIWAV